MNITDRTTAALSKLREIVECKGVSDGPWNGDSLCEMFVQSLSVDAKSDMLAAQTIMFQRDTIQANADFMARSRTITPALAKALIVAIDGFSAIRSHHVLNNALVGRDISRSRTIKHCDESLNSILEIAEAL